MWCMNSHIWAYDQVGRNLSIPASIQHSRDDMVWLTDIGSNAEMIINDAQSFQWSREERHIESTVLYCTLLRTGMSTIFTSDLTSMHS